LRTCDRLSRARRAFAQLTLSAEPERLLERKSGLSLIESRQSTITGKIFQFNR
jgi:hypothetical protein